MSDIHGSCEDIWDHDLTGVIGPKCQHCKERLGRMDYLSGAGDW